MTPDIKPGDIVEWTSQSAGTWKTKRGKVLAIVPRQTHINKFPMFSDIPDSRIKFDFKPSMNDRAIVEVPRGGRSKLSEFYAPKLQWLRKVEDGDEA